MKTIFIPPKVSNIEGAPFAYCDSIETIKVDKNNPYYDARKDCNAIIKTDSNELIQGCKNTIILDDIKTIGMWAFEGTKISTIELPEGLEYIRYGAFLNCKYLTSVISRMVDPLELYETYMSDFVRQRE